MDTGNTIKAPEVLCEEQTGEAPTFRVELARAARAEDLLDPEIQDSLTRLATKIRRTAPALAAHEVEDLVQSANERVLSKLHTFQGRSQFKTWVCGVARRLFIDLSRRAKIRPTPAGETVEMQGAAAKSMNPDLREGALRLFSWLKDEGRAEVPRGAEVLTLLINSGANWDYVSQAMTAYTRTAWTVEAVKGTVRRIKRTDQGRSLCEALNAPMDDEEDA